MILVGFVLNCIALTYISLEVCGNSKQKLYTSTFHYPSFIEASYLNDPFKSILAKTCSKDLWILGYYFHTIRIMFIPEKIY